MSLKSTCTPYNHFRYSHFETEGVFVDISFISTLAIVSG
jgi:hypothetical protein